MEQVKMIINEGKLADESKAGFCANSLRRRTTIILIIHPFSTMTHCDS